MIVLYEHPLSPYAQKVKIALREKGVEFEPRMPDLFGGGDTEFQAANPRREVPALVDVAIAVFDSTIILEYIEDRWPDPPLLPTGAAARARVRMLEELCDTYYEAINWAVFEVRVFQRATGDPGRAAAGPRRGAGRRGQRVPRPAARQRGRSSTASGSAGAISRPFRSSTPPP